MAIGQPLLKGIFVPTDGGFVDGIPIPFLYNPEQISEDRSVEYATKNPLGYSHPVLHYKWGNGRRITFTMTARDQLRVGPARVPFPLELYIELLYDLTMPIRFDGVMLSAPPTVYFVFSTMIRTCKITNVNVLRKEFRQTLMVKAADISITMIEVVSENRDRLNSFKTMAASIEIFTPPPPQF